MSMQSAYDRQWVAGSEADDKQEAPQEFIPAWLQPFHEAITSGLVDGRGPHGSGPTTSGTVSDQP